MKTNNKFAELKGRTLGEKDLTLIRKLDRQLSEDKELLVFLIDNNLVNDDCKQKIQQLIDKHTEELK